MNWLSICIQIKLNFIVYFLVYMINYCFNVVHALFLLNCSEITKCFDINLIGTWCHSTWFTASIFWVRICGITTFSAVLLLFIISNQMLIFFEDSLDIFVVPYGMLLDLLLGMLITFHHQVKELLLNLSHWFRSAFRNHFLLV